VKKVTEYDKFLNEAKAWPPGAIALVNTKINLGKYDYGWNTYRPEQASGAKGGLCVMKIQNSGRKWIEGKIIAGNCLSDYNFSKLRADKDFLENPGPEWKYISNDLDKNRVGKSFYLDGNEKGILDMEGKEVSSITEGEYTVRSYNFELSASMKEPVLYLTGKTRAAEFNIPISVLEVLTKELNNDQKEVIAEWFAKELGGAEIEVDGDTFVISQWFVKATASEGYPSGFSAGPFVTEKQAKDIQDAVNRLNKHSMFDPNKAKVETPMHGSKSRLKLDQLIDWAKTVGVKTTMKELLELRKGAVTAKKFGI